MAYRYCHKCGRPHDQEEWWEAVYCTHCGTRLLRRAEVGSPQEVQYIDSYPDMTLTPRPATGFLVQAKTLSGFAVSHPYLFSVSSIGLGVGAIMLAPYLISIGHIGIALGFILIATGVFQNIYGELDDAVQSFCAGYLLLLAAAGMVLAGFLLGSVGVAAVAVGGGVGTIALAKDIRRHYQLKKMNKIRWQCFGQSSMPKYLEVSPLKRIG